MELTNGMPPAAVRERIAAQADPSRALRLWNATYRGRVARWPVFLVTKPEFLDLADPPEVSAGELIDIFGRIPATLTPPIIDCTQLDRLRSLATHHIQLKGDVAR